MKSLLSIAFLIFFAFKTTTAQDKTIFVTGGSFGKPYIHALSCGGCKETFVSPIDLRR